MQRGHVFIVNAQTLPIHLQYLFVGTGAGNQDSNIYLLADMFRVKAEDLVFFYIEGSPREKGRFFGIFQACDNVVYYQKGDCAYSPQLGKKLIYRKRIAPMEVYAKGVLEWIALDKLPENAEELLWTLIYRKMKGKRGNTMLLPWEVEKLIALLRDENQGHKLMASRFAFDPAKYEIQPADQSLPPTQSSVLGTAYELDLGSLKKSESYFQAFVLQKLSVGQNTFLPEVFGKNLCWIGNEVPAGSGMQKIDLVTIEAVDEGRWCYRLIELKVVGQNTKLEGASRQLKYYVNWAREDVGGHFRGATSSNIIPILLIWDPFQRLKDSEVKQLVAEMKQLRRVARNVQLYLIDNVLQVSQRL